MRCMSGCVYVNPDFSARGEYGDWNVPHAVVRAAVHVAEIREQCLDDGRSRAFETVLSVPDKLEFIRRARDAGFFTRLIFRCTNPGCPQLIATGSPVQTIPSGRLARPMRP